jgi:hypothetical protein
MEIKAKLRAAALAAAIGLLASAAAAAPEDYEFKLVADQVKEGSGAVIAVRLLDKRTGTPVAGAVIFATRMDMEPDGMEAMTSPVEVLRSDQPGVYRLRTNLVMAGGWRLSVAAKVQGEPGTVVGRLAFEAVP